MRILAFLICALSLISCGSLNKSTLGVQKEKSPAQIYAEDPDRETMRAWSFQTGLSSMNLEAYAAAKAIALLANQTSTLVSHAINIMEDEMGARVLSEEIETVAKETIKGSRIAVSTRYVNRDGTETCYVAVEISIDDIIMNIRHSAKIQEAITKATDGKHVNVGSEGFSSAMTESFNSIKEDSNFLDVSIL